MDGVSKMNGFSIRTSKRNEFVDITGEVNAAVAEAGVQDGIAVVFTPHTTAGITINEDADPSVVRDILVQLEKIAPPSAGYTHTEGNSDSHIKSSLIGCSETVIVRDGKLQLGTWQGIYFCEFDGPRTRQIWVKLIDLGQQA